MLARLHSPILCFSTKLREESSKPEIITGIISIHKQKKKKKSRCFPASGFCLVLSTNHLTRRKRLVCGSDEEVNLCSPGSLRSKSPAGTHSSEIFSSAHVCKSALTSHSRYCRNGLKMVFGTVVTSRCL